MDKADEYQTLLEGLRKGRVEVSPYYFEVDMPFYREEVEEFVPGQLIDVHSHANSLEAIRPDRRPPGYWPEYVSPNGMTIESLLEGYIMMLPGKQVRPVIFTYPEPSICNVEKGNKYVAEEARRFGLWPLIVTDPSWTSEELQEQVEKGSFVGLKPFLSMIGAGIRYTQVRTKKEIEIFDFLPKHHLELADRKRWLVMLHIPRAERLADLVNIQQLMEIDEEYPHANVTIAHVGRAYCPRFGEEGLSALKDSENLCFDISANTNQAVFEKLIDTIGPDRIVFGSDMPIAAMHARRECEGDTYMNTILGADWEDAHTRIGRPEDRIVFFLYEEIVAFKRAAENKGLTRKEIKKIFFHNAKRMLESAQT